ncbi:MAG: amidohydrolase family protein, partial [Lachnospiraceae bacterium]|nr:amidohydrolase family protein [Lachnospiraceae bacterium]
MKIIGNGRMITRNSANPWYDDGAVAFDGGIIKKVGTTAEIRKEFPDAEFIDAKGGVIMPGLINAHNHIYSAFARGLSINGYNPKGFLDILDGMWWTLDRHLKLEQTRYSAIATYIDCIKNGVTTIFDHHASYGEIKDSLFAIGEEAKNYGIRSCLCYEVSDRDGKEKCMEGILENEAFIKYAQKDDSDMIAGMFGLHAQFTLSDETLYQCNAHRPEGAGYHIHVAEGI